MIELPEGPFSVIYADPPWHFKCYTDQRVTYLAGGRTVRAPEAHYETMTTEDICNLPVNGVADKDCVLFLWATWPMLEHALRVIGAWGFTYKTEAFTWVKVLKENPRHPKLGLGYWTRCLRGDSVVTIYDAISQRVEHIAIEDIARRNIGTTFIWSHTGWKLIYGFYPNGTQQLIDIDTRMGTTHSTASHRWAVKTLAMPRKKDGRRRLRQHKLSYETIANIRRKRMTSTYSSGGVGINLLFSTLPMESPQPIIYWDGIDLDGEIGWLIGLWAAKGSFGSVANKDGASRQVRFTIHCDETDIAERVSRIIDDMGLFMDRYFNHRVTIHRHVTKGKKTLALYASSSKLRGLMEAFIAGHSAHTKRLNLSLIMQTTADFRHNLLMGMLDGDGTKGQHGYSGFRDIRLCNEPLIHDFRILCHSIGIETSLLQERHGLASNGTLCTSYGLRFVSPRNKLLFLDGTHVYPVEIKDIADGKMAPTYDLCVEDHVFIADDLITHNSNTEPCLLATKGQPKRIHKDVGQVIAEPLREHSRKPDCAYERVERLVAGPYLELFARQERPGWTCWGDEVGKFSANQTNMFTEDVK